MAQQTKCAREAGGGGLVTEDVASIHRAICDLYARFPLFNAACILPAPHVLQPGDHQHTWVTIRGDGTNQWNSAYVHWALSASSRGCNNLASCWLFERVNMWKIVLKLM